MISKTNLNKTFPYFFLAIGIFLIINCKDLFSDGMFMDGLIYSTISKNLADGKGTFWNLFFSETRYSEFHEHPPLAMGFQSLFFTLFGSTRYIDKFYSFFTFSIIGLMITLIWKSLKFEKSWIPLFLWLLIPLNFFACSNNLIENTLSIFILLSVLFYLKSTESKKYLFISLSGIMLAFGFLTKGFVTFFPWTLPFMYWIVFRKTKFMNMFFENIILILSTLIPVLLLIIISETAKESIIDYINTQVIYSIKNVAIVKSRFYIIFALFNELLVAVGVGALIILVAKIKKIEIKHIKINWKLVLFFVLVALTGVLPLTITLKQRGFYLLPVIPLFTIAISIIIYPLINSLYEKINLSSAKYFIFKLLSGLVLICGIFLTVYYSNTIGRNKPDIEDIYVIMDNIDKEQIVNILPEMSDNWILQGYLFRFKNISVDLSIANKRDFLIVDNRFYSDTLNINYQIIPLNTEKFKLLKLKNE